MKTLTINEKATINANGNFDSAHCKPVICIDTGDVYTSVIDAAEQVGCSYTAMISHLKGKLRTCKGKRFCYLSKTNESLDSIVTRLREASAMEEDARKWRELQAEQEAARQAEEKRMAAIAKAEANVQRLEEMRAKKYQKYIEAIDEHEQAKRELEALKGEGETEVA